jgi:hypothetical protein
MANSRIGLFPILLVCTAAVMIFTNPSADDHIREAHRAVKQELQTQSGNWGVFNGLRNLGTQWTTKHLVDANQRTNFLLFSTHTIYFNNQPIGRSWGAFGNVWITQ